MPHSALIFKVNQLGDNVVFVPVVQRLAAAGIFRPLVLWTTPLAAPLYENLGGAVRLEILPRNAFFPAWKTPAPLWSLIRRARSARPRSCLVAQDMGNTAYLLALLSGARNRIGVRLPHLKVPGAINHPVSFPLSLPVAEKSWLLGGELARQAGLTDWPSSPPAPDLSHLVEATPAPRFDFLIHPGASLEYQRWPLERYARLAGKLAQTHRVGWVHDGSPPPDFPGNDVTVLETRSLAALVAAIAGAGVFVGNNSGPMHLASAVGTPSLILSGPSSVEWDPYWHVERFRMLRDDSLPCIRCDPPGLPPKKLCTNREEPLACLRRWSVETVYEEAIRWRAKWEAGATSRPFC